MSKKTTPVTRANFVLNKLKKIGGGSVSYEFKNVFDDGGITNEKVNTVKSTYMAHPDLLGAFDELTELLVKISGYDVVHEINRLELNNKTNKKAIQDAQKVLAALNAVKYDSIDATGVSIGYKDGKPSNIVISGKQRFANGKSVGFASPQITLEMSKFGVEDKLENIIDILIEETYCFEYEGKKAQQQLGFDDENPVNDTMEVVNDDVAA